MIIIQKIPVDFNTFECIWPWIGAPSADTAALSLPQVYKNPDDPEQAFLAIARRRVYNGSSRSVRR